MLVFAKKCVYLLMYVVYLTSCKTSILYKPCTVRDANILLSMDSYAIYFFQKHVKINVTYKYINLSEMMNKIII